jgi:hypothetical protein
MGCLASSQRHCNPPSAAAVSGTVLCCVPCVLLGWLGGLTAASSVLLVVVMILSGCWY